MEIFRRTTALIFNKKRAVSLLLISLIGFYLFLQLSLGPDNFLRTDSDIYHVDFGGIALMIIFIIMSLLGMELEFGELQLKF